MISQSDNDLCMKALIYQGIRDVKLQEKEIPECGPNDVVVRNMRAGICGTDITGYLHGGEKVMINPGREFGHEMVGYVVKKGDNITEVDVGARVFVEPSTCVLDPYEADMAGAFSQYMCVHNAKLDFNLYLLPDVLTYDDAVLIEPYSVATHGKNRAHIKPDENVMIIGAGTIGLCALCSLIAQGNKKVVVLDIDDRRLEIVEKLGGIAFNTKAGTEAMIGFLEGYFGVQGNTNHRLDTKDGQMIIEPNSVLNIDAVIDCAGIPMFVDEFMKHAKQKARYCCIALHKHEIPIRFHEIMSTQCSIMGSRGYEQEDIKEVISNLTKKNTEIAEIITHKFTLEDAEKAFETAADPSRAIKVVVNME